MLLYSYRAELENRYKKWLEENSRPDAIIKDCPVNVINFLYGQGFLNEEKILECLRNKEA